MQQDVVITTYQETAEELEHSLRRQARFSFRLSLAIYNILFHIVFLYQELRLSA